MRAVSQLLSILFVKTTASEKRLWLRRETDQLLGGGGGGGGHKALASEALAFLFCFKGYFYSVSVRVKGDHFNEHFWCVWIVLCTIKPVILFGILGNYLFLRIWENILIKLGK